MAIIQTKSGIQFSNEFQLEETVWENLPKLLNLTPFKRQYAVKGQFCDILALDEQKRLVIIELKNAEDRYVVQQITRYYDAIKEVDPFGSEVNFEKPIRLIAIAPGFHQDTLVDCKYNVLKIELFTFEIRDRANSHTLLLNNVEGKTIERLTIKRESTESSPEIIVPEPPRKLLNWLSYSSPEEFKAIISLRHQILSFDARMKEVIEPQRIIYGRGKTKPCAEIKLIKEWGKDKKVPQLFLWLPHPEDKPHTIRVMVIEKQKWREVSTMAYAPYSNKCKEVWHFPNIIDRMKIFNYQKSLKLYQPLLDEEMKCSPANLVSLALETWQARF
jgi:RecB family endonuclease NucS